MPRDLILNTHNGPVHIGDGHKTFIIAEIGQNHQGDIEIAKKLIRAAKESGADCVKFQKTCITEKFTTAALNRVYDNANSWGRTYGEHKRHLEFSDEQYLALNDYAKSIDVLFTASAMDETSLDLFPKFNAPFIKIGSGDTNNFPLIEKAARMRLPIFLSTGMQHFITVKKAYEIISNHHKDFILMHCVSSYPTQPEDITLGLVHFYRAQFRDVHLGYSGHEVAKHSVAHLAVAAGCKVIERHFTLDKTMKGSDHVCSLTPEEFAHMVTEIRRVEMVLGNAHNKRILPCELPCRDKLGKSLVATRCLPSGHILTKMDVAVKVAHPSGIRAEHIYETIGKQVTRDVQPDETFQCDFVVVVSGVNEQH